MIVEHKLAKPVGVFVRSSLPGGVRVTEPDIDLQSACQFWVAGHFGFAVIGHTLAQCRGHRALPTPVQAVGHPPSLIDLEQRGPDLSSCDNPLD